MRRRITQRAVIALGSNLGDREATLASAARALAERPGVELVALSAFHDTVALRPEGADPDAPRYLNAVALVDTSLAARELLAACLEIEAEHGRVRGERWADRSLDLDLVAFGPLRLSDAQLTLPHPRAAERDFVLRPWLEVDPEAELPGHGRVDALLARLEDGSTDAVGGDA